jgi:hypothetical protein
MGNAVGIGVAGAALAMAAVIAFPQTARPALQDSKKVPAAVVGSWTWGTVSPGRYVNKITGEYVGHAGGGAVSHFFAADGTYTRYVLIQPGAAFPGESIFSVIKGKVTFNESAGTFTIRLTKGEISFEKKSGITRRPLSREDMERSGTVFTYHLEKGENGSVRLFVNDRGKPAKEGREFRKDSDGAGEKAEKKP